MERKANGEQVSVRVHTNPILNKDGKRSLSGIVTRNHMDIDALVKKAVERNPGMGAAALAHAAEVIFDEVHYQIKAGNTVSIRDLGTLYIGVTGVVSRDGKPTGADIKGFTVRFTPDSVLKEDVNTLVVDRVTLDETTPTIKTVVNTSTNTTELEDKCTVCVEGSNLKLEGTDSSIWLALYNGTDIDPDTSTWLKVNAKTLFYNQPARLLFQVPDISTCSGKSYKVVVRTRNVTRAGTSVLLEAISPVVVTVK